MSQSRSQPTLSLLQTFTGLLAFVCLWMGTGAVLHHTDDLEFTHSMDAHPAVRHITPLAPPDECAACEWTHGLQTVFLSVPRVLPPQEFVAPRVSRITRRLFTDPPTQRTPRAPPFFLS